MIKYISKLVISLSIPISKRNNYYNLYCNMTQFYNVEDEIKDLLFIDTQIVITKASLVIIFKSSCK